MKTNLPDFSLLPALKTLLIEKNVSRAADKMNLSQPAMSRIFTRLKSEFNDPLMVRTGNQYQLTPRGHIVLQQLNQLMPQLEAIWQSDDLPLSEIEQTLVLSGTDMDIVYVSERIHQIQLQAPKLHLAIRSGNPRIFDDVINGEVDLALTAFEDERAGLYRKIVTDEPFVVVTGKNNPYTPETLDLDNYLQSRHGKFSFAESTRGRIDAALKHMGLKRQISLSLPTFLQIPSFLADPHILFSVPQSFANYLAQHFEVKILPLPFEVQSLSIYLYWHERLHFSQLHRWVRESLLKPASDNLN
ncbi:LysR substrate-binding domain-containing protein [Aliikangiella coralliicola]|uniref:LysR family transcriptional regulator n=1 Tax=Aliikangiella coralliicola TaxID=2592383 RepID=A0A545UFX1_9GAMM|nr:LysR substrate-binding domain-containing protein [Aliikangiella coralliicola]TQV88371.1 LysR family transcriptional regulator [Aliikangiella coralliicola]